MKGFLASPLVAALMDPALDSLARDPAQSVGPKAPEVGASSTSVLYPTASDALKAVHAGYHYWTGKLTEMSLQLSYAVIAANWVVFGSVDGILKSRWSKLSVALVVGNLGLSVAGARWLGELLRKRVLYAGNAERWEAEFKANSGTQSEWPSTQGMQRLSRVFREVRTWLSLAAGLFFLIALLSR